MRNAEIAKMRAGGVPFRTIAERLGMSLGAVQNADRRARNSPTPPPVSSPQWLPWWTTS